MRRLASLAGKKPAFRIPGVSALRWQPRGKRHSSGRIRRIPEKSHCERTDAEKQTGGAGKADPPRICIWVSGMGGRGKGFSTELASAEPSNRRLKMAEQMNPNPSGLAPVQEKFILHWGEMGTKWGI